MIRINPDDLIWGKASKTKDIKAIPMCLLINDPTFRSKLLLDTLEGNQKLADKSMVCLGVGTDVWQQDAKKLLAKYDLKGIDTETGWHIYSPRPENEVECCQITSKYLSSDKEFEIIGLWGKETPDGFIQYGVLGDFVCRNIIDKNDVWIVKQFLFLSTYNILEVGSKLRKNGTSS